MPIKFTMRGHSRKPRTQHDRHLLEIVRRTKAVRESEAAPELPESSPAAKEKFILAHGLFFIPADIPAHYQYDRGTDPYTAAHGLARKHDELQLAQGYVLLPDNVAVEHVWAVRPDGYVADPTWGPRGLAYFGVITKPRAGQS